MPKTGATKYQKFLKSEKSKTKLKSKKDLPKGTNVTKTNFKVKKIVLKDQLSKHGATEALSTRKLNIKELLTRLNHFNTKSRTDALTGLKELITTHPGILEQNLGQLIHGVTPLILNIEKVVRIESLKILNLILSNVDLEKVDPFFDIMCTYLRSAMTHIDGRIQEDSLLFLDTLLLCTPKKVSQDFHKIIPNFLDMISKLRVDSKPGRTLTVNLGSQSTSAKWREKVLHRLQDFLHKFTEYNLINRSNNLTVGTVHNFDDTKLNYHNLFNPTFTSVCRLTCFSSKNSQETPLDEVEKFKEYINTLMPLLFETWLEVCSNVGADRNIETVIGEDASSLLKHILQVISLIWELVQHLNQTNPGSEIEDLFCQKFSQAFVQNFVRSFPYVCHVRSKQKKSTDSPFENVITDSKLVLQNLEICYLYVALNPHVNVTNQYKEITLVLNYIKKTFNQNSQDAINNVVVKILNKIFSHEINSWTDTLTVMETLFRKIIWAYFNEELSSSFKQNIFTLLCKIALNNNLGHFHSCDSYEMWLMHLPDILMGESVTTQTIDILHKFAVCNNQTFNTVVQHKLPRIIENLPKIIISDANNDPCTYYKLFSCMYWIKSWDCESLDLLEKQLLEQNYKNDHATFILDTLKLRIKGMS